MKSKITQNNENSSETIIEIIIFNVGNRVGEANLIRSEKITQINPIKISIDAVKNFELII